MNSRTEEQIEIRKAKPSEAEMLTEIAIAAKQYWNYPEESMDLWKDSLTCTPDTIRNEIVYVAKLNKNVIGFYCIIRTETDHVYELDDLWVRPEYIGRGIGNKLFKHAARMVEGQGGKMLRLVAEPNATGFYLKMGMHKIGERASKLEGRILDVMAVTLSSIEV